MTKTKEPTDHSINGVQPINQEALSHYSASKENGIESTTKYKGFTKGISGNPQGRPKGSLNKIKALFYDDLYNDWDKHGNQAIVDLRLSSPVKYCQMVASILPRSIELDDTGNVQWVINAKPVSTQEWQAQHGLIEHDKPAESDT